MTRRSASNVSTTKLVNKITKESANVTMEGTKTTMSQFILSQESWIINSGTSSHMCKDVEKFENLKPATGSIGGADSRAIAITGEGRVRILTKDSTRDNRTLVFEKVLLIPSLEHNLFSICAIVEKEHWTVFEEHGGFIKINGEPLKVNFGREENLFTLHCGEEKGLKTGTRNEKATLETCHRRMGHQEEHKTQLTTTWKSVGVGQKYMSFPTKIKRILYSLWFAIYVSSLGSSVSILELFWFLVLGLFWFMFLSMFLGMFLFFVFCFSICFGFWY